MKKLLLVIVSAFCCCVAANAQYRRFDAASLPLYGKGFGGTALPDMEAARLMADLDAGCYVPDFVHDASAGQILEPMAPFYNIIFYNIIRYRRPGIPEIFVEDPLFPDSRYDQRMAAGIDGRNRAIRKVFDAMVESDESDIYHVSSENMIGGDGEATIDGIHFTCIGMARYADLLTPVIEKVPPRRKQDERAK
jgi:hypothetical protein